MSGEVCQHCGAHYWLCNEDGRFCGSCGLHPFTRLSVRGLFRESMEHGHDPIGDSFDAVGRYMLYGMAATAIIVAILLAVFA